MLKVSNFIERSILGALSFLKQSIFADEYAAKKGLLQSLDPKIKTITFFLFIVLILFVKNIGILLFLYSLCLALALFSKINLGFFLKRTWFFIPLFSVFIAIPALFSVFTPGETLVTLSIAGLKLIITRQGFSGAVLFVARVITSVSFVVLLNITTKHFELLRVLRIFKIPQVFVMTLGICYRYIYLFMEIIENTYLSIKSRIGTTIHYKKGQRVAAWNMGSLWQRSSRLNDEVYTAMLSRGYRGEPVILDEFKTEFKDWMVLFCAIMICLGLIYFING